jgi:hypothetical protein
LGGLWWSSRFLESEGLSLRLQDQDRKRGLAITFSNLAGSASSSLSHSYSNTGFEEHPEWSRSEADPASSRTAGKPTERSVARMAHNVQTVSGQFLAAVIPFIRSFFVVPQTSQGA